MSVGLERGSVVVARNVRRRHCGIAATAKDQLKSWVLDRVSVRAVRGAFGRRDGKTLAIVFTWVSTVVSAVGL
jgi:hypothetical protein